MSGMVKSLAEKIQSLSSEEIAEVNDFVDFLRVRARDRALVQACTRMSEPAFATHWSNPEDDVYDSL